MNGSTMLEVRQLNKRFGEFQAVRDLNFQIKKGEVFGFLGPNGAGKTTTMRMITCFIPPTSGAITVDGMNTHDQDLAIRKRIGYLPESNPLYNDMLVEEYVRFVGGIRGLSGSDLARRVEEMIKVTGLTTMRRRQISKLSKGYRQRVGLAQAMIHDPDLLILDEPTSGLDPNQIVDIRNLIKKIGEEKTVIYCSHILSEVSATCDRILIINNGSVVATGTAEELTNHAGQASQYTLRVRGDKESVETRIAGVPGVSACSIDTTDPDWMIAHIAAEGSADIGEQLFRCAVDNGWSLAELKRESASLEKVFTQLTRG